MEELIDQFEAVSDEGGVFTVRVYQQVGEFRLLSGEVRETRGAKRLALSDGSPVNWIDEKTFKIVFTDQIIRKV
ncbi:MAG: hypothetical protein Q8R45_09870 [Brevundimonas sp.]|uniref:hypothetical protein n=1 Tax=Brevundimonas sp. TaxID=1871086 RepID=UPI00271A33F1|nr:hypothetical protein [Brevundimonas sp.]MDO9586767.1 hypothetical protein [Brevundimonas sp.]MDP3657257.1 hypothetical protein [Brevundimonas sp.]